MPDTEECAKAVRMARKSISRSPGCLTSRSCSLLVMLMFAGSTQLPGFAQAQAPSPSPDLSNIPEACVNGGTDLQTQCSETLTQAQTFFNVKTGPDGQPAPGTPSITQEQINAYIAQAPAPTAECCKAACDFNANFCSCEQGVLDFAVQLTANDPNAYKSVAMGFAAACQFKLYYGETCAPKAQRGPLTTAALATCAALPPPLPAGAAGLSAATLKAGSPANGTSMGNATAANATMVNGTLGNVTAVNATAGPELGRRRRRT